MAKILIIDDDPDIVEAMKVVLENKGYEVAAASSGEEGLDLARKDAPDLVILDIMMETGDKGFDVARSLKADKRTKNTPILMLTGIENKMGLSFKKEAGDRVWLPVDDYVEKPIKPEELVSRIKRLLKG